MAFVIGIGGSSQSGKSCRAKQLKDLLKPKSVCIIELDLYTFPADNLPKIKDYPNWEVPESIDFDQILAAVESSIESYDVVIVEGIHAFANQALNKHYDLKLYLELSKSKFLERRSKETRWGKEPEWYAEHVWNSHIENGLLPEVDLIIAEDNSVEDISTAILEKLP